MTEKKMIDQSLTSSEIVDTLNAIKGDSKCPFCGSEEILIDSFADRLSVDHEVENKPIISDTTKVRYLTDDSKHPALWYRTSQQLATPMIRAVCQKCGCSLFFDYQILKYRHSKLVDKNGDQNK